MDEDLAANDDAPFDLVVKEGEVWLHWKRTKPPMEPIPAICLGAREAAMTVMADFLAHEDFGEKMT